LAAVVPGGDGSVSGFINTFMPPELLVAVTPSVPSSSSASPVVSAAVPATPKKESRAINASQSNKITAFVKSAAVAAAAAAVVESSPSSSSSGVSTGSPTVAAVASVVAPVIIHTLVAKKKSPKKVDGPSAATPTKAFSDVRSAPEVIELL
jgi:hypothetical protein